MDNPVLVQHHLSWSRPSHSTHGTCQNRSSPAQGESWVSKTRNLFKAIFHHMERLQCPWKNGLILLLIWLKWPRKAEGFQYLLRPTYKKLQQWDFWTASVAFPNQGWGRRSQAVCSPTRSSWRYSVLTLYFSYGSDFGLGIEEGTTLYVLCYSLGSINPLPGTLHLVPIGNNLRWTDVFHFWFFHSFLNVSWRVLKKKKNR